MGWKHEGGGRVDIFSKTSDFPWAKVIAVLAVLIAIALAR